MAQCITCGSELHPERADKYNYCMARECQEKNAKGLTMVAVGVNKAADLRAVIRCRSGYPRSGRSRGCRAADPARAPSISP
jgi:hypothetical protein